MSAILAILAPAVGALPLESTIRRMVAAMSARGTEVIEVRRAGRAIIAVGRGRWELESDFSGPVLVAEDRGVLAAVDAAVYYRDNLRRSLAARGVEARENTPAHLVLAAYRAWGEGCAEHLEGDFAFVVWDSVNDRLVAARDFGGKRPLFHATVGATAVVASSISAILSFPGCPTTLNLVAIAEEAAAMTGAATETCYQAISRLAAGWTLAGSRPLHATRHWQPPRFRDYGGDDIDSAAEELRHMLRRAVRERMATSGPTALFLSGGYDSPAVFATARAVSSDAADRRELVPISISYPPADSGREDELIAAITEHVGIPTRWLPIATVAPPRAVAAGAARRNEPAFHPFELPDRALAKEARTAGARVTLDGDGGDYLFSASLGYLADLFWGGRWVSVSREWRSEGGAGARQFFHRVVRPRLHPAALHWAGMLARGRPLDAAYRLRRTPPPWISNECTRLFSLREREAAHVPTRQGMGLCAYEGHWQLTNGLTPKYIGILAGIVLEHGLEHRSPLYDRRIVEFAARRPTRDRRSGGSTKVLLRRAMEPLLPPRVLAPRVRRTGVPSDYLTRMVQTLLRGELRDVARRPLLADVGILDADAFRRAVRESRAGRATGNEMRLMFTVQAELWLRGHTGERPPIGRARQQRTAVIA